MAYTSTYYVPIWNRKLNFSKIYEMLLMRKVDFMVFFHEWNNAGWKNMEVNISVQNVFYLHGCNRNQVKEKYVFRFLSMFAFCYMSLSKKTLKFFFYKIFCCFFICNFVIVAEKLLKQKTGKSFSHASLLLPSSIRTNK